MQISRSNATIRQSKGWFKKGHIIVEAEGKPIFYLKVDDVSFPKLDLVEGDDIGIRFSPRGEWVVDFFESFFGYVDTFTIKQMCGFDIRQTFILNNCMNYFQGQHPNYVFRITSNEVIRAK